MRNTNLSKKMNRKKWATFTTIIALFAYLAFLFIPVNSSFTTLLPYNDPSLTFLPGSLLSQIIYICTHFNTAFQNLTILHYATFALIGFMAFVLIHSLLIGLYKRRSIHKINILHAGLAIAVIFFYIIALLQTSTEITKFTDLFLDAQGQFTFVFPTYLPLLSIVALAIAIVTSFSTVRARAFFRIILLAVATVSLTTFLFPIITKSGKDFTMVDFMFNMNALGTDFNSIERITFIALSIAVLVNYILIVFYLGSKRFGAFSITYSALYFVIAITGAVFVIIADKFNHLFTNATMYVAVASLAQLILISINAAIGRNSFKNQVDILNKKYEISKNLENLGDPMRYNANYDDDGYEYIDEYDEPVQYVDDVNYIIEEEVPYYEEDNVYGYEPVNHYERVNNYYTERNNVYQQQPQDNTLVNQLQSDLQEIKELLVEPSRTQPQDNAVPSTDATIVKKEETVRQKLEELKADNLVINTRHIILQDDKAMELAAQNAQVQHELEKAQLEKRYLEEQIRLKELESNTQAQKTLLESKELLESIQREKESLDQQALENEKTRQAIEEMQQLLTEAKLAKQEQEKAPEETVLSFLTANPEYKNMTSAAYEDVPLTVEEAKDPFIRTLTTAERVEFYQNFMHSENHKIPAYVLGGDNSEFFDIIVIYIGSFAGKISFELISKILEYSDKV